MAAKVTPEVTIGKQAWEAPKDEAVSDKEHLVPHDDLEQRPQKVGARGKLDIAIDKVCYFTIMDVIEDNVRVRFMNVLVFLLIFIFFVLGMLHIAPSVEPVLKEVRLAMAPPLNLASLHVGQRPPADRTAKVVLSNDNGSPRVGVAVRPSVLEINVLGEYVYCSTVTRRFLRYTLEYLRHEEVCKYTIEGEGYSDDLGLAKLNDLAISGPAGFYQLGVEVDGIKSEVKDVVSLRTKVFNMYVRDPRSSGQPLMAPYEIRIGEPFAIQPSILLVDAEDNPVEGIEVVAFSNIDPVWPPGERTGEVPVYNRQGQKYSELGCARSKPSDKNGLANFTCLKVISTTSFVTNIVFTVDAAVFRPWNDPTFMPENVFKIPLYMSKYSTDHVTDVDAVEVVVKPPNEILEGDPFPNQVQVRVKAMNGSVLSGVTCYALIVGERTLRNVLRYRQKIKGYLNKELMNPKSEPSNAGGIASWRNLSFSQYGNSKGTISVFEGHPQSNEYTLEFVCDGIESEPVFVQHVTSRVHAIRVKRFIKDEGFVSKYLGQLDTDGRDVFSAVVRVLDKSGRGVYGKTVLPVCSPDTVICKLVASLTEFSQTSGFAVVSWQVVAGSGELKNYGATVQYTVSFKVDGVTVADPTPMRLSVRGRPRQDVCNTMFFPAVMQPINATAYTVFDISNERPKILSGGIIFAKILIVTPVVDVPFNMLDSSTRRPTEEAIAEPTSQGGGTDNETEEESEGEGEEEATTDNETNTSTMMTEAARRLGEDIESGAIHRAPRRRLVSSNSSAGTLQLHITQAYSDEGVHYESPFLPAPVTVVPFEPKLTWGKFTMQNSEVPTLDSISSEGGEAIVKFSLQGADGTHWIQIGASIQRTGSTTKEYCVSPALAFDVHNALAYIDVTSRSHPNSYPVFSFADAQNIIIDLKFHLEPGVPIPPNPEGGNPLYFAPIKDQYKPGAVVHKFSEVPMMWQYERKNLDRNDPGLFDGLDNEAFEWTVLEEFSMVEENGIDVGKMALKLRFKLEGMFGQFALIFAAYGTFSDPLNFDVSEPPNLQAEVLVEPGFKNQSVLNSQTLLPQQATLKITSNGRPINGAKAFAEFVPNDGSTFEKMTMYPLFDVLGNLYSWPSGYIDNFEHKQKPGDCGPGGNMYDQCLQDWTGIAMFHHLNLLDGEGKGRIRFWLSFETPVPGMFPSTKDLNFRSAVDYQIVVNPPSTIPLSMSLESLDLPETQMFTVQMKFPYGFTDLARLANIAFSRFSIGKYNGMVLSKKQSQSLTRKLFTNRACFFIDGLEYWNTCSPLKRVPGITEGTFNLEFQVLGLTWEIIDEVPTEITLVASDISMTPFREYPPIEMPLDFLKLPSDERNSKCLSLVEEGQRQMPMSNPVTFEALPKSGRLVLAPPDIVEVGSVFAVRLFLATASGGPVKRKKVKVAIVPTLAIDPKSASGDLLQQMAEYGNTMQAVAQPDVDLDPAGISGVSDVTGVASFALTALRAKSGRYVLKFQADDSKATVLFTTPSFSVTNPINTITSVEDWNEVEVKDFKKKVTIPKQLQFNILTTGNRTLQDFIDNGYTVNVKLGLKGVSPKVVEELNSLKKATDTAAEKNAGKIVQKTTDAATKLATVAGTAVGHRLMTEIGESNKNPFNYMSPSLSAVCRRLPMASLALAYNETIGRMPEVADAVSKNPDVIDPKDRLAQFIRTITGAGQKMALSSSMRLNLEVDLDIGDLKAIAYQQESDNALRITYEVTKRLEFLFVEGGLYAWEVSINGIRSASGAFKEFKAVKVQLSTPEKAWNWIVAAQMVIFGALVLATNTVTHHILWYVVTIPITIAAIGIAPTMEQYKDALLKAWPYVTVSFLAFLLITQFWGLSIELMPRALATKVKAKTFGRRRMEYFEIYTRRRLCMAIFDKSDADGRPFEPHPATLPLTAFCKQMIKPFNPETAFYFPSQMWVGLGLSMLSYAYILITAIKLIETIDDTLLGLINKAVQAVIKAINNIEASFVAISGGQELPDSATAFMLTQIQLVRGWFVNLVDTIKIGFIVGTIVAGILTITAQFHTFYTFRRWSLQLRIGKCAWGKRKDGAIVYDSNFMGQYVATTAVGFILIVIICVLLTIPFNFKILWDMIWHARVFIIWSFLVPFLIKKISVIIAKKIIFDTFSFHHRALASIFMFWQLFLSILGGIMSALVRFVFALVGVVVGLPSLAIPCTPEPLNKIMLLDTPYKTFLAAIMMYHCHNHPVVIHASRCLLSFAEARRKTREISDLNEDAIREAARKRSHRWVILLLMKHPWLRKWRKRAIAERRKLEEAQEKAKKEKNAVVVESLEKVPDDEVRIRQELVRMEVQQEAAQRRIQDLEAKLSMIHRTQTGEARHLAIKKLLADVKLGLEEAS